MEKYEAFNIETDSIEEWLEGFDAITEALDIRAEARKIRWIKATVGPIGRGIIQNLGPNATWDQVKRELRRFLGHEDSRSAAWRSLKHYKAENKSLGQIASEVMGYARRAADEEDVQQRLAMETFLDTLPRPVAKELRKNKPANIPKALDEAKFLMALQEDDERRNIKTLEVQQQNFRSGKEARNLQHQEQPQPSDQNQYQNQYRTRNQYQNQYQGQNQYQNRNRYQNQYQGQNQYQNRDQNRSQRRTNPVICWACDEQGHIARDCPLWKEWKEKRQPKEQRQVTAQEDLLQLNW